MVEIVKCQLTAHIQPTEAGPELESLLWLTRAPIITEIGIRYSSLQANATSPRTLGIYMSRTLGI